MTFVKNGWKHLLIITMLIVSVNGCVRRRLTIRSNPPGALVVIDDQEIGTTPVSTYYTYYGTRKIQLFRDGYKTVTQYHTVTTPWWQIPPIDFFSEHFSLREKRDERFVDFVLEPLPAVDGEALRQRAHQLRSQSQQGYVVPTVQVGPETATPPNIQYQLPQPPNVGQPGDGLQPQ